MRRLPTLLLALLVFVAGLAAWLGGERGPALLPAPEQAAAQPDYYLKVARVTRFDAQGKVRHHLSADSITHQPGDDSLHLSAPKISWLAPNGPEWHVEAGAGIAHGTDDRLDLSQGVTLVRKADAGCPTLTITTDYLSIDGDQQRLTTLAPVRIRQAGGRMSGVGMVAEPDAGRLQLLAQVEARHDPL